MVHFAVVFLVVEVRWGLSLKTKDAMLEKNFFTCVAKYL